MTAITSRPLAVLILTGLVSCSVPEREAGPASLHDPGVITHVVLFDLVDAGDVEALIADCDRWLAGIPSVVAYDIGQPFDMGRAGIDLDFDLGLVVAFADVEGYRAYLEHPDHVRLVEVWKPQLERLTIHDWQ